MKTNVTSIISFIIAEVSEALLGQRKTNKIRRVFFLAEKSHGFTTGHPTKLVLLV
jgi:hypothetical protein